MYGGHHYLKHITRSSAKGFISKVSDKSNH